MGATKNLAPGYLSLANVYQKLIPFQEQKVYPIINLRLEDFRRAVNKKIIIFKLRWAWPSYSTRKVKVQSICI
ncbi:Uncharacterised protein [Legionella busanensis]|uniref:Uncharacterized protein n=1 Tax=Legionella busanensis TaxID=190655 RepID=A0A378JP28_9GAMM|nr:Uncharacterised protein [Legionella busanensis]